MDLFNKVFGQSDESKKAVDDKALCSFIKNKVEESRSSVSRISHEGIWMTNTAYCLGFDSVFYDTSARQFKVVGRANQYLKRNRIHVNKMLPTLQNRLSRLVKSRPKFQTRPQSNDEDDKEAARLSEQVLDMLWQKEEMSAKQLELYMWVQQCGHAYLKVCWDDTLGKEIQDPETGEMVYEGDIRVDVVSPFEIFPDPLAKTFRDCQWLVQAKIRKLDYFRSHFGALGAEVKEEDAWLLSAQYESRINSLNVAGPTEGSGVSSQVKGCAIELVYYEKRSKNHPNGRMVVCANGVLLEDKELPVGEIPLQKFDDILIAGKYYSEAIATHLRPVQDQYNRIISRRAAWTNKLLAGKYLTARGHELSQESFNDESGEVVEHTPVPNAPPPAPLQIPMIPSYAYNEEESLERIFNEISGLNEVSRGQAPGQGITAAIALQYLSEQDDTRIGVISRRLELAMARTGRLMLMYAEQYYQTPRLLKIAGQNLEYTVKSFVGADLKGNTDVTVIEGSTLPGSITAKRDFILTIYNQGLLGSPQDPKVIERVLKLLEFGDVGEMWEDRALVQSQIKKSIEQIQNGEIPEVNVELDNHEAHVIEKNKYRLTDKFTALAPELKEIFMQDIENHIQAIVKRDNPQLELQRQHVEASAAVKEELLQNEAAALPNEEDLIAQQVTGQNQLIGQEGI